MRLSRLVLSVAIGLLAFPAYLRTQSPSSGSVLQILGALDAAQGEAVFRAKGCFDCGITLPPCGGPCKV